jgi:uncharacterized low-complexity protein
MKTNTTTLALALTTAIGMTGFAHAAGNPFALNTLTQGYQVAAADKVQDGKCGDKKEAKTQDGKCGGAKDMNATETKAKDGKCGEGKCGANKK